METMRNESHNTDKDRRRSCYDRFRYRLELTRRKRRHDPAFGAIEQLFSILGFAALTMPRTFASAPGPAVRLNKRAEIAAALGIPKRYVDVSLRAGRIPTSLLFDDLRRPAARGDALVELRKRLPQSSELWLDYIVREEAWSELRKCHVQGSDERTSANVLKSTIRWFEAQLAEVSVPGGTTNDGGGGGSSGAPPASYTPKPSGDPEGDGPKPR